jgi:tetratricopeptide (TPR) repeat protein
MVKIILLIYVKAHDNSRKQYEAKIHLKNQRPPAERGPGPLDGPSSYPQLCWWSLIFCCIFSLFWGCSGLQRTPMPQLPANVPARVELDSVPFYPQDAYQCGPATLAMALTWSGLPVAPDEVKDQVYTPSRKGSLQIAMVSATRRNGRIAYEIDDSESIFPEIAAGHPVIILQNLGLTRLPVWHYAVVIGYDVPEQEVILRSGTTRRKVMSYDLFEKTWSRGSYWGLMVLNPDQLPVLAKENDYLASVVVLEKTDQYQAAATGYQTAITRWPNSLTAWMGLGYSRYKLGDLRGADSAFRQAAKLHPQSAAAFNNLAHVLLEQGRIQEALVAAHKAVELGGPLKSESEKTLQEIRSGLPQRDEN